MNQVPSDLSNGFTLSREAKELYETFWARTLQKIENDGPDEIRVAKLPLARIKKIVKMDEDVQMISSEVPVLFSKAAEIFIQELAIRSWIHTEESKRRTIQRDDISMAVARNDQFDFLIDIVPRPPPPTSTNPGDQLVPLQADGTQPTSHQSISQSMVAPPIASENAASVGAANNGNNTAGNYANNPLFVSNYPFFY